MSQTGSAAGSRLSVEEKTRVVLSVLAGDDHGRGSSQAWDVRGRGGAVAGPFIEAGKAGLESRMPGGPGRGGTQVERRLRAEAEQLKLALAEARVQLRIWRVGAEHVDAVPSPTSKP